MSGLNASDYGLKPGSAVGQEIDADATGGRSKCMPARQLARSGRGRRKRQFPVSDAASRKIHSRAERGRRSASEAVVVAVCESTRRPCVRTWRRGRGETPCRSARPFRGKRNREDRQALGRTGHGAMTRVRTPVARMSDSDIRDGTPRVSSRISLRSCGLRTSARARRSSKSEAGGCLTIECENWRGACPGRYRALV